jgi:hypothetical protein
MAPTDYHFLREDRRERWRRIADRIAAHPEEVRIALNNIERWLAHGRIHPAPILEWRRRIHEAQVSPDAFAAFVAFLAAENHDEEPLKSCSPFVGLPYDQDTVPTAAGMESGTTS